MSVDPNIQSFLDQYHAKQFPPYTHFAPQALRTWFNEQFYSKPQAEKIPVADVNNYHVDGPDGQIRCRVYTPEGKAPFPALMYFHGGGFVIRDDMAIYDQTCRRICQGMGCVVIAVDFRLAPEHPFPAAPEDCYAATCWAAKHAQTLNIDTQRFGVWGESCGGNLATVVPMMARDRGGPKLACQVIVTPMLDVAFDTLSYHANGNGTYLLSVDTMRWFWEQYLHGIPNAKHDAYCAPCQASDLHGLPPAIVITVDYDPLRDEGAAYAQQLEAAGVSVLYHNFPGLIHGFFDHTGFCPAALIACREVMAWSKQLLT